MDEVRGLASAEPGPALNESKKRLAFEITALVHGDDAAKKAEAGAAVLFGDSDAQAEGIPTLDFNVRAPRSEVLVIDALVGLGLVSSNSVARRLIQQGGVYVNGQRVDSIGKVLTKADHKNGQIFLRVGKKKYGRIVVE